MIPTEKRMSSSPDTPTKTPAADMQADDAGTADSGIDQSRPTAVESAMKQTSKTAHEAGSDGPSGADRAEPSRER
jgi:hypothetical protein